MRIALTRRGGRRGSRPGGGRSRTAARGAGAGAGGVHDGEVIFAALADAGATYLHIASEGRNWIETAELEGGLTITGQARRVTGLPVIANGGMHDAELSAQVLGDGHADFVSVA